MSLPPEQWILQTLYEAGKHSEDTFRVFQSLRKHIFATTEPTMLIYTDDAITHKPVHEIADDCFFSICKFCEYLNEQSLRTGAPDCEFYSDLGRTAFDQIGYPNISNDWVFWVSYVRERLNI